MAYHHSGAAPVYATNSEGRSWADETGTVDDGWTADGEMVRSAYTPRSNDDDFTQPGILVREAFDDTQRQRLVDQVAGSLLGGVREPVLSRAFQYRSEEHTSELPSLMRISYAVFCLKKKKKNTR